MGGAMMSGGMIDSDGVGNGHAPRSRAADASGRAPMATIIRGRFRRHRRSRAVATVAARALLSATLVLAAGGAPVPFQDSLAASHLLPPAVVGPLALALSWLAALAALYLVIGLFLQPVALVTAAALLLATGMLVPRLMMGTPASIGRVPSVAGSIGALPLP